MAKKELKVGLSGLLNQHVATWMKANIVFPADFLAEIKQELLKKNFKAAAGSLSPAGGSLAVRYDEEAGGLCFYRKWDINSSGPPLARTLIYKLIKKKNPRGLKQQWSFYQQISPPLPDIMFSQNVNIYVNLDFPEIGHQYDHYYCLPEEMYLITTKLSKEINQQAQAILKKHLGPFNRAKCIKTNT